MFRFHIDARRLCHPSYVSGISKKIQGPCFFTRLKTFSKYSTLQNELPILPPIQNSGLSPDSQYLDNNIIGVQLLPEHLHYKVFGHNLNPSKDISIHSGHLKENSKTTELSIEHLKIQGLLKEGQTPIYDKQYNDLKLENVSILGKNIRQHFVNISNLTYSEHLEKANSFQAADLPPRVPKDLILSKSGWTRYSFNPQTNSFITESVSGISEHVFVFDVENIWSLSHYPLLATAVSDKAWYIWVSPYITGESTSINHLIQISDPSNKDLKLIIGHNVSYDRARISEEYSYSSTPNRFIDTMSLHIATSGLCSQQRPIYNKVNKFINDKVESPEAHDFISKFGKMASVSSNNSLKAAAKFHLGLEVDKDIRNTFVTGCVSDIRSNLPSLIDYCLNDVDVTAKLYKSLFPKFLKLCPHPASFAGMLVMTSSFLPVSPSKWKSFIERCQEKSDSITKELQDKLVQLAYLALKVEHPHLDPWLKNLDWTPMLIKKTKPKTDKHGKIVPGGEPKFYKSFKKYSSHDLDFLIGKPKWFTECYDIKTKSLNLTFKLKITPYLLRLTWLGYPLYHSKKYGWTFVVPKSDLAKFDPNTNKDDPPTNPDKNEPSFQTKMKLISKMNKLSFTTVVTDKYYEEIPSIDNLNFYFRIPHKDGEGANCGSPLSKNYLTSIENNILGSSYDISKEAIKMNALTSYWVSVKNRVLSQFVAPIKNPLAPNTITDSGELGMILPQVVPMGTITRRGVEPTWATASNSKKNRIGSEIKTLVSVPNIQSCSGKKQVFKIVGADVDSEELWISSLMGDSQFKSHGSTALGYMGLLGTKAHGNDMHSTTAKILGIDRNNAKVFNYSRIYGAGVKHATQLLCQYNPSLTELDAHKLATSLYLKTKGVKMPNMGFDGQFFKLENDPICLQNKESLNNKYSIKSSASKRKFWAGGSESYMFNSMEDVALNEDPRTPVLKCGIVDGLQAKTAGDSVRNSY
ncbi:DNA polymerase gamma, mitochondrial [Smittium mucronatum]|uniref:Mitochondrial DNA polymerase catalytic subunit n=1 Tax=Smittium mucronatum TaxID=133383 RepID=A0A1R0H0N4_9FUNG|nr:DNA polymerase gamma, mitochondrial [Smittium mucronatum]